MEWIFRSPRTYYCLPPETAGELLESEVATMKYIKLNCSIPVPDVFDYRLVNIEAHMITPTDRNKSPTRSNTIGIPFILMSKASGSPLSDFMWNAPSHERMTSSKSRIPYLTRKQKGEIMRQLGAITSQLSNLRFDKIGSLFEEAGEYNIKKCLSPALILHDRDTLGDDILRGPFQRDCHYYESLLSAFLLHVKELPIEQHAFFAPIPVPEEFETFPSYRSATDRWNDFVTIGSKIDSSKNRLDYCIAGHFIRKMIPSISHKSFATLGDLKHGFPLCHPDLSTSNIFVDDKFNITCIIDWAFSSTVPISTLLMTPGLPHPRDEVDTKLVSNFRAGFIHHFFQGKDVKLHPEFWVNSRNVWLFTRLVILDGLQDYHYFAELYRSVYKLEEQTNIPRLFNKAKKEEEFLNLSRTLAADDRPAAEIREEERQYFSHVGVERQAISRKLTVASEWSEGFIADKRLWRWLEEVMACL